VAQKIVTLMVDDMTGQTGDDVESTRFPAGGVVYEIDLAAGGRVGLVEVLAKVDEMLAPYVSKARRMDGTGVRRGKGHRPMGLKDRQDDVRRNTAIRDWAKANGHEVSTKGRLSKSVVAAYDEAQRQASTKRVVQSIVERHGPDPFGTKAQKPQEAAQAPAKKASAPRKRAARKTAEKGTSAVASLLP
jgi:Lsr2